MHCMTTFRVSKHLTGENWFIDTITAIIANTDRKQQAILVKGYDLNDIENPFITQLINIKPKSEVTRTYSVNAGSFQFNFWASDFTAIKISVSGGDGHRSRKLPLYYID